MGNVLSNCSCRRHRIGSIREITLLMLGLDNAGKTCTAKHLLGESTADSVPTIGFSSVQVKHGKFTVTIYDLGGGPKIRAIWRKYFALVHGLIFVVDASDPQRLEECKHEIQNVLRDGKIAGKPMLLLVNKQDVTGAIDEMELVSRLDLESLVNEQKCPTRVEASCAIYDECRKKDPGITEGFNWLIGLISRDFNELHQRVEQEIRVQKELEEIEKAERMERVQKIREEREKLAENKNEDSNHPSAEDDNDVVIGNPFKPCNVIRAELEEKNHKKPTLSTPAVKVIHVSPTNSTEAKNREELILNAVPLNEAFHSEGEKNLVKVYSKSESELCNGDVLPSMVPQSDESKKKVVRKYKKRFKNRVMPEGPELNNCTIEASRSNELPPLRPCFVEPIPNGRSTTYLPPRRAPAQQEDKIDWTRAEELVPFTKQSSASSTSQRIEAWVDSKP